MKLHRLSFLYCLLVCCCLYRPAYAQRFGGNPLSENWKQLKTDTVRVIYPPGYDSVAQRISEIVHALARQSQPTLGGRVRPVSILLQARYTTSNAYVALAPWRSEWYMQPPPDPIRLGSLPWHETLALHEFRHVQQYSNFRRGLSRLAYILAGEQGQAVANSAAVPDWWFEGDAVVQETLLSRQGRGRLPEFLNEYRVLWQDRRTYSYMKWRNGSLRELVPNHYPLGYMLSSFGRDRYGPGFWNLVTADAVRYRPLLYPFQGALRRHSGLSFPAFVDSALTYFRSRLKDTLQQGEELTRVNSRYVENYYYPLETGKDTILASYDSYRHVPGFVMLTGMNNRNKPVRSRIRNRGITLDESYGYDGGVIVYPSYRADLRWSNRDYSELRLLDIRSGRERKLTRRSRYFTPDIQVASARVAAALTTSEGQSRIHILSMKDGSLLQELPNPESWVLSFPRFAEGNSIVYTARDNAGRMSLIRHLLNDATSTPVVLVPWTYRVISQPRIHENRVLYTVNGGETDELCSVSLQGGEVRFEYRDRGGVYQASMNPHGDILYASMSPNGYRLFRQRSITGSGRTGGDSPGASVKNESFSFPEYSNPYLDQIWRQEPDSFLLHIPTRRDTLKKYPGLSGIPNFHSWRPFYDPPTWSMSLYGQNVLNNFQSELRYEWNQNERFHRAGATAIFGGWYPQILAGGTYTWDRQYRDTSISFTWNEWDTYAGLRVPFNVSAGRWYRFITPAVYYHLNTLQFRNEVPRPLEALRVQYLEASLAMSVQVQRALQHIFPRYAGSLFLQTRQALADTEARQWLANANLYLPGLLTNHHVVLQGAYQSRDTLNQYLFDNDLPFSRGYNAVYAPRMKRVGINYHFPIAYPDWGFGQLAYFLRIRANLFYDHSWARSLRTGTVVDFASVGAEVYFDTRWWNQLPASFGFRYSRLLNDNLGGSARSGLFEFVLPVGLLQ